jgi:signal peptidase I
MFLVIALFVSLALVGLLLNAFCLWLACLVCRVRRTGKDGRPRRVGFGRAVLIAAGYAILGNAAVALLSYGLSFLLPRPTAGYLLTATVGVGIVVLASLLIQFAFVRWGAPTTTGRGALVTLGWNLLCLGVAVGMIFGIRAFFMEAYILPTGSMAGNLLGGHKEVVCPQCGYEFPINAAMEIEGSQDLRTGKLIHSYVDACTCPNCRFHIRLTPSKESEFYRPDAPPPNGADAIPDPGCQGGDRFLVAKGLLGPTYWPPQRLDVVAFQQTSDPFMPNAPPTLHIKRIVGLPGETVAIHHGKLYVLPPEISPHYRDEPGESKDASEKTARMHADDPEALSLFEKGAFSIVRKPPELLLAMRRLVYDNDHPAKDLVNVLPPRWAGRDKDSGWTPGKENDFSIAAGDDRIHWLGYQHICRGHDDHKPRLITDFLGYNSGEAGGPSSPGSNWVDDLLLEAEVAAATANGELTFELSKCPDRFHARFTLSDGRCRLVRIAGGKEEELDARPSAMVGGAPHRVRFSDCDERLTVWVDDALIFGGGVAVPPSTPAGPTDDDLAPAGVAVKGVAADVRHLKLFCDVYFTAARMHQNPGEPDAAVPVDFSDPARWAPLRNLPTSTYFVPLGCYFLLGDNSAASADSRIFGPVPDRLLLGKALVVYYPFNRLGPIR